MLESQTRIIASLRHDHAFNVLLDYLQAEIVDDLADQLAGAEAPADILRLTRTWQVARRFLATLKSTPEAMDQVLAKEEGRDLPNQSHPWMFEPEEDYFRRTSGPIAPPYFPTGKIQAE